MEWFVLVGYGLVLWLLSPWSQNEAMFYEGRDGGGHRVGLWLLTGSVFISWIFAKSITNAANLGADFGVTGGLAYAAWFLSIPVAGIVLYGLRKQWAVNSLSEFLVSKYGKAATGAFLIAIFIRLFNEIWSNTMVVGTYFGGKGTASYYVACFLFTVITLAYSLRGGLRSSIITDGIQVVLMVFFVSVVLGWVIPDTGGEIFTAGELSMAGGLDLLLVGVLQALSYPFHDPVLTDRAMISNRKVMLKAFLLAGIVAIGCIVLFSLVGVHAYVSGMSVQDDAPPTVAAHFGVTALVMMNIIMLSSAGSTIDSTFASLAREFGLDLPQLIPGFDTGNVVVGRWVMVAMAIIGNLPVFTDATIFQATTISGTMVMGLAPIFLFYWWDRSGTLSFHLAFWTGLGLGLWSTLATSLPAWIRVGNGSYAGLLGINLYGLILCVALYIAGAFVPDFSPTGTDYT